MKYVKFRYIEDINPKVVDDLLELTKYMMLEFEYYMTSIDAYNFWRRVSMEVFDCDWLTFSTIPDYNKHNIVEDNIKRYCEV